MKSTTISFALISLLQLSAAEHEHARYHIRHAHRRRAFIPKRDLTMTDSSRSQPTRISEQVVYVDPNGNPVRTTTERVVFVPGPATSTASSPPSSSSAPPAPPASSSPALAGPSSAPKPPAESPSSTPAEPKPSPSSPPSTGGGGGGGGGKDLNGITYTPYKGNHQCKSAADVDADFALFAKDHGLVRIYGVDCDQVANAYQAAKRHGNRLMLGVFDIGQVEAGVAAMAAGTGGDWSIVDTVSIGNELVNSGQASPAQVMGAVAKGRAALRAAGFSGPVVTVDAFPAVLAHPELCDQSDYCAVNVHPFFDPNTGPGGAGAFVAATVGRVRAALAKPDRRLVVTETGWPWKGQPNGAATPGVDHQAKALASIRAVFAKNPADCVIFTAFNDPWKKAEPGTFFAEQFWGLDARDSPADK